MGAFCYYHPNLPAVGLCSRCGRSICGSCFKPYANLSMCPDCYNRRVPVVAPALTHTVAPAPGGVWYGPFPRLPFLVRYSFWIAVVMLFIAAGLIAANGIALLSPVFFATWIGIFPWVAPISSFGFILGLVLGLVILGGVVMLFLGFRALAAFLVLPSAIVSLFIGGGFILGLIIGVLAGILLITMPRLGIH